MKIINEFIVEDGSGKTVRVVLTETGFYFQISGKSITQIPRDKFIEMRTRIKTTFDNVSV